MSSKQTERQQLLERIGRLGPRIEDQYYILRLFRAAGQTDLCDNPETVRDAATVALTSLTNILRGDSPDLKYVRATLGKIEGGIEKLDRGLKMALRRKPSPAAQGGVRIVRRQPGQPDQGGIRFGWQQPGSPEGTN